MLVDTFAYKNPDLKTLQIEAGTSGATLPVIDTPSQHGEQKAGAPRFDHYDLTGISAGFFGKAKDLPRAQANRMHSVSSMLRRIQSSKASRPKRTVSLLYQTLFTLLKISISLLQIQGSCCGPGPYSFYSI